jgi:hypothetical protein
MPSISPAARFWPAADRLFADLPPRLFEDLSLLRHNLATSASRTGQFADVLSAPDDEPWLRLHRWLLDDLACPPGDQRDPLERRLFLAMLCSLLAAAALEGGCGRAAPELAGALDAAAAAQFAVPATAPFWAQHRACWQSHAAALAPGDDLARAAGRLAPLRLGALAAALALGREDLVAHLKVIFNPLDEVFEIWRELETLQRDAGSGRMSPVLGRVLRAGGASAGYVPGNEWLLGALVFGDALAALGRECQARLDAATQAATAAGLPSVAAHCAHVRAAIEGLVARFSLRANLPQAEGGRRFAFVPRPTAPAAAAQAAEGFLLADLSFRESWEIQRTGLLDLSAVVGRPFPAGLIVEILCRHGHRLTAQVSEIFALLQANGFSYFDQPGLLPPDTDDLGLLLRLFPYSDQPAIHRALLQAPLRLLERCLQQLGTIPVWLQPGDPRGGAAEEAPLALWGDDCVTVQAQLILGLLDYDSVGYHELIERAAQSVGALIIERGLGANRYYAPLYALWALATLVRRLGAGEDPGAQLAAQLPAAGAALGRALDGAAPHVASPQDAALLILAANALGRRDGRVAAWADLLIAEQRYDGSWRDEPLFITGARNGMATWYGSRSTTTALGYAALQTLRDA